jgi:hypothetical protein
MQIIEICIAFATGLYKTGKGENEESNEGKTNTMDRGKEKAKSQTQYPNKPLVQKA